jgi:hypothetical protein
MIPGQPLLSNYIAGCVYKRIKLHNTMQACKSIDYILQTLAACSWGGILFEMSVHHRYCKGIKFQPMAINSEVPSLKVQIKKAKSDATGYFHTLSVQAKSNSGDVHNYFLQQYLIPFLSTTENINVAYISNCYGSFPDHHVLNT